MLARSLLFILFLSCSCSVSKARPLSLGSIPSQEKKSIGLRIWENEGNKRIEYLTFWSDKEPFPSLGIGHFTWHPKGLDTPFKQSFPSLIRYMLQKKVTIPPWLKRSYAYCPWPSRKAFYKDFHSPKMRALRKFLKNTLVSQTDFIILRTKTFLPKVKKGLSKTKYRHLYNQFQLMASTEKGLFALIDYINFKGEGLQPKETYNYQGWGLKQVLLNMKAQHPKQALIDFVASADYVLTRRVNNAPNPSHEKKWLKGWRNRLKSYL